MRYGPNQKKNTRARILSTASRMFRERGYRGTGVDAVMKAAGMTVGGFYAHFPSKEALFRESLTVAFADFRERFLPETRGRRRSAPADEILQRYFEVQSTTEVGEGCPIPLLASDVARASDAVRRVFEEELQKTSEVIASRLPKRAHSARDVTVALLALASGATLLRRAVKDPQFAERIFEACRRFLPAVSA